MLNVGILKEKIIPKPIVNVKENIWFFVNPRDLIPDRSNPGVIIPGYKGSGVCDSDLQKTSAAR